MKVIEIADFIKQNIYVIIALTIVLSPTVWVLASLYYNDRVQFFKEQIDVLESQLETQKEKKEEFKELYQRKESTINWADIQSN